MGQSWGAVVLACCAEWVLPSSLGHSQQGKWGLLCDLSGRDDGSDRVCVLTGSHTGDREETFQRVMS